MIKAIFFDSGDVLMKEGFASGIRKYEQKHRLPAGRLYEAAHGRPYWREFTLGNISEEIYLENIAKDLGQNFNKFEFRKLILENFTANTDLIDFIRALKPSYTLGIISNNPKEWFEYLFTKFGWTEIFDVKAVSGFLHIRKPDVSIFQYAVLQAGIKGDEAVYVDNRPERVEGGQITGMKILIFKDNAQIKRDLNLLLNDK